MFFVVLGGGAGLSVLEKCYISATTRELVTINPFEP